MYDIEQDAFVNMGRVTEITDQDGALKWHTKHFHFHAESIFLFKNLEVAV